MVETQNQVLKHFCGGIFNSEQTIPEEEDSVCEIDAGRFALVILWWFVATLLFLAIVSALRCRLWTVPKRPGEGRGTFSPTLVGTPRAIRDVSQTGGKLIITTNGYHNLIKFPVAWWQRYKLHPYKSVHLVSDILSRFWEC